MVLWVRLSRVTRLSGAEVVEVEEEEALTSMYSPMAEGGAVWLKCRWDEGWLGCLAEWPLSFIQPDKTQLQERKKNKKKEEEDRTGSVTTIARLLVVGLLGAGGGKAREGKGRGMNSCLGVFFFF